MPNLCQHAYFFALGLFTMATLFAQEKVGERPYEMVWANRTQDTHPALVDFESLDGWTVETKDAVATLTRSREQQLWGLYVAKLVYRGTARSASVTLRPPSPIPIPADFDCINFWIYGNNWGWEPNPGTPSVNISVLLRAEDDRSLQIPIGNVNWKEWFVRHRKLQPEQISALKGNVAFEGLLITNCHNKDDRTLFFDNLAFYKEQLRALQFEPRPRRGIEMFPGQGVGLNTGPGRLPFPTREETILPDNLTTDFKTSLAKDWGAYVLRYTGADGVLEYRYEPKTGTLGDISVTWGGAFGVKFRPMVDGGLRFGVDQKPVPPDRAQLLSCERRGDTIVAAWRLARGDDRMDATYTFRILQKSLVIDVACMGGAAVEFVMGRAIGVRNPRLVTVPYLVGNGERPAVLVMGRPDRPLFLMGLMDYYRSNASALTFRNEVRDDGAPLSERGTIYNGGAIYHPKTDGKRNDCFERIFLTVSPRFEEVLPNVPNPKSPWIAVTGERLWVAHGASDRARDYARWADMARYGMTKVVITDHETGWRDGGESFTFRTRAAPKKGGDDSQAEYSRKLHALGYRYGLYNNYTDFAPVNEFWDEDMVGRASDGNWQGAWPRCYAPKPARAVEFEARLTPTIQQKFNLSTAYCDVHTAVTPWSRTDYDARVPGAGTFAATFYSYGEIMLHQKKVWNGPVYSEGNNHYYYCGLTDGNYAQDQRYRLPVNPWLVDFDLLKLHPLGCNFGMGAPSMFYGRDEGMGATPQEQDQKLDRFLAATIAFGHTGFFVGGPIRHTVRSYYTIQQLHANYAAQSAVEIRYADSQGRLLDTSSAVASGVFARSQVVTTYSNGLKVWVNGHVSEAWQTPDALLPPNGWSARTPDGKLVVFSALRDGRRADYVDSPAYIYCDGRGALTRFAKAVSDEAIIALRLPDDALELIPVGNPKSFGISLDGRTARAVALDKERKEIGPVETRLSRGLVYVTPREGAFSYLLTPADAPPVTLSCPREGAIAGETVTVRGKDIHQFRIPPGSPVGQQVWAQFEDAWIDFVVLPLADMRLSVDTALRLQLRSNLPAASSGTARLAGQERSVTLSPGTESVLEFPIEPPVVEEVKPLRLEILLGAFAQERTWWLRAERVLREAARLPEKYQTGQCLRKPPESGVISEMGTIVSERADMTCGGRSKKGIFMHPPYKTGVGYVFALYEHVVLPALNESRSGRADSKAVVRCFIGKADGSDPGDGILFRVAVLDNKGKQTVLAEKQWIKHAWTPLEGDLSPWAGQKVGIKLIADVGPADNSSGDWACWSGVRIEAVAPTMTLSIEDHPVSLRHEAGPHMVAGLSTADLRKARRGWFHYEGQGVGASAPYISSVEINGLRVGNLPDSEGGSESQNIWSKTMAVELPREVIEALSAVNQMEIHNPGNDSFKVRRFWIELDLEDGRKCSSRIATSVFSQPGNWAFAEGIGVKFGNPIESEIVFDLR